MPSPTPSTATLSDISTALTAYPTHVPSTLTALDTFRYTTLPALLATRLATPSSSNSPGPPPPLLSKAELVRLVDWKLHHGTYRPALLAHVRSNPDALIEETVATALAPLLAACTRGATGVQPTPATETVQAALAALTKPLKGVGPATASLVLSVAAPESVPFFSDELFRWSVFGDAKSQGAEGSSGKGGGSTPHGGVKPAWTAAKISYSAKEYGQMVDAVRTIRERLVVDDEDTSKGRTKSTPSAVNLEKAAFVWSRTSSEQPVVQLASSVQGAQREVITKGKETQLRGSDATVKKRKASTMQQTHTTRSSSRRKTS